ncbi:MAG: hypothetical protein AMS15_00345 [Planctomycetes bacterium DG_23]|nr:MAG: hypothetical protein AMS15_00345 [Planctomycetes bacterium DG_23]
MRLLLINYEYPPIGGGAANATEYLLREFSRLGREELREGIEVDLVTSSVGKHLKKEEIFPGIWYHGLPVGKRHLHFWRQSEVLRFLLRGYRYVKSLLAAKRFSLCHAFFGIPGGLIAYSVRSSVPYILSLRGSDVPGFNVRFRLIYPALAPILRPVWKEARRVIANSQGLKELALKTNPTQPIQIIPNGVDTEEFHPAETPGRDGPIFLTVSRLIQRKGLDLVIRGFAQIAPHLPKSKLIMVGEGNLREELEELAFSLNLAGRTDFRGYVPHSEMPKVYRSADIFVLASRNEGMSNAILEAMASGLPIITTATGGIKELIRDNGIVVPQEDVGTLVRAMGELAGDKEKRVSLGKRSRERAQEFSWSRVARAYIEIYQAESGK